MVLAARARGVTHTGMFIITQRYNYRDLNRSTVMVLLSLRDASSGSYTAVSIRITCTRCPVVTRDTREWQVSEDILRRKSSYENVEFSSEKHLKMINQSVKNSRVHTRFNEESQTCICNRYLKLASEVILRFEFRKLDVYLLA